MTIIKPLVRSKFFWLSSWVVWMGVIFAFSSLSGNPTYYEPSIQLLIERKGAHVVEYFILFLLSAQVFSLYFSKESLLRISMLAVGWSLMYAALDELHQYFVPFRGAHIKDVGIDALGIGAAALLVYIVFYWKTKKTHR